MAELKSGLAAYLDALGSLPTGISSQGWERYARPVGLGAPAEVEPPAEAKLITEVKPDHMVEECVNCGILSNSPEANKHCDGVGWPHPHHFMRRPDDG